MTRKSFAIRHIKFSPPDEQTAGKYFLSWHARDLYHAPGAFPRLTSEGLFGCTRPMELEIGCGTGEHLCALAAETPAANFVGIDISLKSLYAAVEQAKALSLENVMFIKAGAQLVYPLLDPGSLRAVYLHFPDPCLRPKYRKRRIFNERFLDRMHYALTEGGLLSVMTDVPSLFMDMLAQAESDPRFEKIHPERYLSGPDSSITSRYQATWEKYGIYPMRFVVKKT
jgi:tRNA (guanine-N7-)-methyltransferase